MADDRSLDEFASDPAETDDADAVAGNGAESQDATGTDVTDVDDDEATSTADVPDVDPAVSTATWTTDTAACGRCGEPVSRRWLDDDALVCGDCKEW